ncbi:GTA-gp10 family protein [Neomegalonema sp.]|uniref:GTA-gp10 family protein n=1 Tax=Neomegalonema sp. TaxID=2039713 RepID=UPI002607514C|nr:GTA-gp10 family protein [Neomegalonema sp.]MDD2870238.1 GTA-gp10 family protein [Neomegalonema sp.]
MANPVKGEVGFEVDGTSYKFVLSTNALCELEDAVGLPVSRFGEMLAAPSMRQVRAIFWAGLIDHHPGITPPEAGRLMDRLSVAERDSLLERAFRLAFPEAGTPQKGAAGNGPRKRAGTG